MMEQLDVVFLLTEFVFFSSKLNKATFAVHPDANKKQIKEAVEALFKVKVTGVRTLNVRGKPRRIRGSVGVEAAWKKAYVSVAAGQKIEGV